MVVVSTCSNLPFNLQRQSFYRDDFDKKGLHRNIKASDIPFEVEGRRLILVDDVLYTGRTIRAALDELADFGAPQSALTYVDQLEAVLKELSTDGYDYAIASGGGTLFSLSSPSVSRLMSSLSSLRSHSSLRSSNALDTLLALSSEDGQKFRSSMKLVSLKDAERKMIHSFLLLAGVACTALLCVGHTTRH